MAIAAGMPPDGTLRSSMPASPDGWRRGEKDADTSGYRYPASISTGEESTSRYRNPAPSISPPWQSQAAYLAVPASGDSGRRQE